MELKHYWMAVKSGWLIVVGALVVSLGAAAVLTWPNTPQYVSSTRLFVAAQVGTQNLDELYERNAIAQQRIGSYVALATSGSVAREVSDRLGFQVDSGSVQADVVPDTVIMEISVTDPDPGRAREIAAAYADVVPEVIEDLEQVANAPEAQVRVQVIDEAGVPGSPVPSPFIRNLVFALVLGLGAGVGLAVLRYVLRQDEEQAWGHGTGEV